MKTAIFLVITSLFLKMDQPIASYNWIFDVKMSCEFISDDSLIAASPCQQYYRKLGYDADSGEIIPEWAFMWKDGRSREVHYIPRRGMIGTSIFTIGEVDDNMYNSGRKMDNAVSYSKDRENIVIGVPSDGYIFYVRPAK